MLQQSVCALLRHVGGELSQHGSITFNAIFPQVSNDESASESVLCGALQEKLPRFRNLGLRVRDSSANHGALPPFSLSSVHMKLPAGYVPGIGVHKATAYGGYGEKLLKQLGWKEGQGLGAEGQGISSAIKVHKKEDTIGVRIALRQTCRLVLMCAAKSLSWFFSEQVGRRQSNREQSKNWWEQAYNSAAQTIQVSFSADNRLLFHFTVGYYKSARVVHTVKLCKILAKQEGKESPSSSSSDDSEDDEPGTPPAKVNCDGTAASGTKEELRLARELAKDPWGRFGGRNGKLARIRRQEALAAASQATGTTICTASAVERYKSTRT